MKEKNIYNKKFNILIVIQSFLFLSLIAIDRITKLIAVSELKGRSDTVVIKGILSFSYVENHGAAFGIFENSPWLLILVSSVIFLCIAAILVINNRKLKLLIRSAADSNDETSLSIIFKQTTTADMVLVVLAAGAFSNLLDRFFSGYVIDFIKVTFIKFPVFNAADIYVTLSALFLIIYYIFIYKEQEKS